MAGRARMPAFTEHPAGKRRANENPAEPFNCNLTVMFPDRPREVICELLHYRVEVDPLVHTDLPAAYIHSRAFVRATRGLVSAARTGQIEYHIGAARARAIIPNVGNVNAEQLYEWGRSLSNGEYTAVFTRLKEHDRLTALAPGAYDAENHYHVQQYDAINALWAARRTASALQKEERMQVARRFMQETEEWCARMEQRDREDFRPVSTRGQMPMEQLTRRCLIMYSATRPAVDVAAPTEAEIEEAIAECGEAVRTEYKHELVAQPEVRAELLRVMRREQGLAGKRGDRRMADRFEGT